MVKYVLKRIALMLVVFLIITTICFVLVKLLPDTPAQQFGKDAAIIEQRREQLGYNEPIPVQLLIFFVRSLVGGDWGLSEKMYLGQDVMQVFIEKLPATMLVNTYTMIIAVPIGLLLGIFAALKKNKWQDHLISTGVMVFISVPSYVYALLVQYILCFRFPVFPMQTMSGQDAATGGFLNDLASKFLTDFGRLFGVIGEYEIVPVTFFSDLITPIYDFLYNLLVFVQLIPEGSKTITIDLPFSLPTLLIPFNYLTVDMFWSLVPAIIALGFGTVAGLARYTRAELCEVLTQEYMLLARTKGLTRGQATVRHALRNSMVPIFPMIMGEFIGIIGGSLIIEQIFGIPGVGPLYIKSITSLDYNFYMLLNCFYTAVGLASGLLVDLSYGFVDPRIRMGEK